MLDGEGRCTVQQLPVGGPQLVSHTANTHLNMSWWSPTRSPHQPGANYFSSGVQPGPRLGSSLFSLVLFFFHYHHFYFGVLPKRQFTLIWQGRQMLGTVARMCRVTRTSWGVGGGQVWPFNLRRVFHRGKMAMMIATHGRNSRGSSNVDLYLETVIYTSPLLYCWETELSSFHSFVKADFCTSQRYLCFLS